MRTLIFALLFAVFMPAVATAQTAPAAPAGAAAAPAAAPPAAAAPAGAPAGGHRARGADISRDEYIERAVERARRAAEKRFDRMDTDHDGILTAAERRAARTARRGGATQ